MRCLNTFPALLLTAPHGEEFTLDEAVLKLYVGTNLVYLSWENTEDTFACLRNKLGCCLMAREELVELIRSREYVIE